MARRPALALVRPDQARSALAPPSPRTLALTAALLAVLGLAYLAARETSLFAIRAVEVSGGPPEVNEAVRSAVAPFVGTSLVAFDGDELLRRLAKLPSVRSARYDRSFPHTLRVVVLPERPLAVLRIGAAAWLVSESGRVVRALELGDLARLPRVWTPGPADVSPGEALREEAGGLPLRALSRLPARFPARVVAARAQDGSITLILAGKTEVRLGEPAGLRLKLEAAAHVLQAIPGAERAALAYLDVSLPERAVAGYKSQVEGRD